MYRVFNEGPNPKGLFEKSGKMVTIEVGEEKELDLSEDMVRILLRRDGTIHVRLTEEQAAQFNGAEQPPIEYGIEIPDNWRDLEWNDLRRLARSIEDV